jgi:hypothetical protein
MKKKQFFMLISSDHTSYFMGIKAIKSYFRQS